MYAKKDIAIFDDVTSALDARTLRAVSNRVFGKDGVLRSKGTTVVLATHAGETRLLKDDWRILLRIDTYLQYRFSSLPTRSC